MNSMRYKTLYRTQKKHPKLYDKNTTDSDIALRAHAHT